MSRSGMRALHLLMAFAVLALAACSKPTPPVGIAVTMATRAVQMH